MDWVVIAFCSAVLNNRFQKTHVLIFIEVCIVWLIISWACEFSALVVSQQMAFRSCKTFRNFETYMSTCGCTCHTWRWHWRCWALCRTPGSSGSSWYSCSTASSRSGPNRHACSPSSLYPRCLFAAALWHQGGPSSYNPPPWLRSRLTSVGTCKGDRQWQTLGLK